MPNKITPKMRFLLLKVGFFKLNNVFMKYKNVGHDCPTYELATYKDSKK